MAKASDGRRVARIEKEVQQAIASFVLRDMKDELPGLVTISQVKMPADLRSARVAVSVLAPGENERELRDQAVEILQERAFEIQEYLGSELQLRFCPKLSFIADETTDRILHIEKTLRDIGARGEGEENE